MTEYKLNIKQHIPAEINIKVTGYNFLEKSVFQSQNTTAIFLPKTWGHKKVLVIALEEIK